MGLAAERAGTAGNGRCLNGRQGWQGRQERSLGGRQKKSRVVPSQRNARNQCVIHRHCTCAVSFLKRRRITEFDPYRHFRTTERMAFLNVRTPIVRALCRQVGRDHRTVDARRCGGLRIALLRVNLRSK